jgi:hypothetical protein
MDTKERILEILYGARRNGMASMVRYLEEGTEFFGAGGDFFTAPASTKHHLAYTGGLAQHSLSVYEVMVALNERFDVGIPHNSIAVTGLLHDLCKTGYYVVEQMPIDNGIDIIRYETKWTIDDKFPLGHGEKSLYLVSKYLHLEDDEAAAIRWHMGCWTSGVTTDKNLSKSYNAAMKKYPLVTLLSTADLISSRLLE